MREEKKKLDGFFCNKSFGSPEKSIKSIKRYRPRGLSQNKILTPKNRPKLEDESSKEYTPKSPISVDWNLETKSNIDKKFTKPELELQKRGSEKNLFMQFHAKPFYQPQS